MDDPCEDEYHEPESEPELEETSEQDPEETDAYGHTRYDPIDTDERHPT